MKVETHIPCVHIGRTAIPGSMELKSNELVFSPKVQKSLLGPNPNMYATLKFNRSKVSGFDITRGPLLRHLLSSGKICRVLIKSKPIASKFIFFENKNIVSELLTGWLKRS